MSRFISLSSTIRILANPPPLAGRGDFLGLWQPHQSPAQYLGQVVGPFGNDLAGATRQQFALRSPERHRRQDNNRDAPPLGMPGDLFEKPEKIARHAEWRG